jgi:hypothetical protein
MPAAPLGSAGGSGEPGGELVVGEAHVLLAGVQVDDPSAGVVVAASAGPATTPPSTPAASPAAPIPAAPRSIPRRVVPGAVESRLASADS